MGAFVYGRGSSPRRSEAGTTANGLSMVDVLVTLLQHGAPQEDPLVLFPLQVLAGEVVPGAHEGQCPPAARVWHPCFRCTPEAVASCSECLKHMVTPPTALTLAIHQAAEPAMPM